MRHSWIPLLALAGLLAACQGVPVNFAGSTVTDRSQVDAQQGQRISAEASGLQVMVLLPFNVNDRQQRAFADLRKRAGERLLADIVVTETWRWVFIGTLYTTRIDATAYPRMAAEPAK